MKSKIQVYWQELEQQALAGGGVQACTRQAQLGKFTARKRLELLLDTNSFSEIDQLATSSILEHKQYTDGVITGFGTIQGRRVAIYAQDFTIKGGSLGKRHAEKICKIMDMAVKIGCPIIGIIDSGGARIDEGIHALEGYGKIFKRNARYSGIVPQISIIVGPCAGGATYSPALTDFIFMTETIGQMFITGPQVIAEVVHQAITKEDLGGAQVHATMSGVTHNIYRTEAECFQNVKVLLEYLPSSYLDPAPSRPQPHSSEQTKRSITVPLNPNSAYNIKDLIGSIADFESFFEIHTLFAPNIVIGFARFDGNVVGVIANQPCFKAGTIDIDASCKASRFIHFCDSFGIPLVTFVDTPGYLPGVEQEHNGIIRHGAKLAYAYACASVPKITIIIRKAFGGAYIVMGSKGLGSDFNAAWPEAQIAVLGAKAAVSIMHGKKLAGTPAEDRIALQQELEANYATEFLNPFLAAEHGYIDAIIEPTKTRDYIIATLRITQDKVEVLPKRKNGNGPL